MKIKFQIDYRTHWGQGIYISGSIEELGSFDESKAVPLTPGPGEQWELEIETKSQNFSYRYFLKDENNGAIFYEFGDERKLNLGKDEGALRVKDNWRSSNHPDNSLYTSPFKKAFFTREGGKSIVGKTVSGSYLQFQIRAPRIGKDYSFGIIGSIKELGEWDESKVVLMDDSTYPVWSASIAAKGVKTPFEYKYVIYSHEEKRVVTWENRDNRYFQAYDLKKSSVIISDEYFEYPVGSWKAAGVAIPVFSLRSDKGGGVGEFTDINTMVDWSVKTGMKIVQILPVNDTVATHTWVDSYPYAAISVHALHPMYANMQAMGGLKNKKKQKQIDQEAQRLNKLAEVDYEAVMVMKSDFFKLSFDEKKESFLKSKAFKAFFQENESWLLPYACFSYLRDRYNTPDFTKWDEYAIVDEAKLQELADPSADQFSDIAIHYYIQYHLDKQLKEASEYARSQGVVLKGDIPIGIYRNSVDAWIKPELYNMDCQAGAPPDDFSISGQNWGFPTYNWEKMAEDDFEWWRDRLVKMSEYFDVFRIDHILGFFRIWEIPWEHVEGLMGRFNPAMPIHNSEFGNWGIGFDPQRFATPYVRTHMVYEIFGNHAHMVFDDYLDEYSQGCYRLKPHVDTQRKVKEIFDGWVDAEPDNADFINWLRNNLYRLLGEVLFLEAPLSNGEAWNPRIGFHSTYSYRELDDYTKSRLNELYVHFFYHRHNDFWRDSAMRKLPAIKDATDMLIGGEDLGMVPASVPGVMDELSLLSLAIQRMPNDDREFLHPADNPYLSVCSTGSHDMSSLREWWQEDQDQTQRFYNQILGLSGGAPYFCEPWIARDVINQHMHSPSMLAIFPLQDFLAMDMNLRRESPEDERINVPAITQHYWRYRMHISLEQLLDEEDFNGMLRQLVDQGGRKADY